MAMRLAVIGFVSILGQVALLRELNVAFFGSELVYILALGVWLLGTALGAGLGRRDNLPTAASVSWLLLGAGVLLPAAAVFVRGSRRLFGAVPGAYLPFAVQLLALALAVIPLGVALGLLFQWAARRYVTGNRTLAAAYALECTGGMAGGALATLTMMWGLANLPALLGCALLAAVAGAFPPARWRSAAGLLLGLLLVLGLIRSQELDRALTRWDHPHLLLVRDTPYGRITADADAGQISLFVNGALAYESQGTAAEEFVHLAALQHPRPDRVLVLGGGLEGMVAEVAKHQPTRLDYVELNGDLLDMLAALPLDLGLEDGPRIIRADPRRFLDRPDTYDLILVGMPEPASGQDNRFYTREFFAECASSLAPGGVLAFRLPGAENLWTAAQARRAGSIHRALTAVLPAATVLPGASNVFLASAAPLPASPGILAERLAAREIGTRLVTSAYLDYLYTNDRFAETAARLGAPPAVTAPPNTDARPVSYRFTLLLWLSRFFPGLGWADPTVGGGWRSPWFWCTLAAVGAAVLARRRGGPSRRAVPLVAVGAAGMVIETVLLLNHQARQGALFQDLGLLITCFMAGMALGAAVIGRVCASGGTKRWLGPGLWVGLILLCAVAAQLLAAGRLAAPLATGGFMVAGAFLTAGIFAHLGLRGRPAQEPLVAPLYAADLAGGCLGSLAASLYLIPVLGLAGALWVTAGLAALGMAVARE